MDETPNLRRLIVVAPYTNILTQTAERLRRALVLPDERADEVVVEHHHRADFSDRANRELAVLWHAPIVLTTAVSFFETLAGCDPASLRKLHALPGSAVFLDEATSALDEGLEFALYQLLRTELPGCVVVSVSHRPAVEQHHDHLLELLGEGRWELRRIEREPARV